MSDEQVGERTEDNRLARTFAGLLLAPVAGGFGSAITVVLAGSVIDFINRGFDWSAFESLWALGRFTYFFLIYAVIFGVPISLVIGTPVYLALKKLGVNGFFSYLVGGAAIGMIGAISLGMLTGWGVGLLLFPTLNVLIACSGLIGGITFWLIRRPDRDTKLSPIPIP